MDNTKIAVRERGVLEILDLSLHITRMYAAPLAVTLVIGTVPWMLLNQLLIGWMADVAWEEEFPFRYLWNMFLLVVIEAPLASVFATAYMGLSVFQDKPGIWRVVKDVFRLSPRLAFAQLLVRGIGPACLLYLALNSESEAAIVFVEVLLVPGLAIYTVGMRAFRPFLNEIVLLEKNPLRAKGETAMTIARRSALLHGPSGGEIFARWMLSACIAVLLFCSFYASFFLVSSIFMGDATQGPLMVQLVVPLIMWLVAGYFTVVRFLSYLDLRIRQEGWEVELRLKSEAAVLQSRML